MKKQTLLACAFSLLASSLFAQNETERKKIVSETNVSKLQTLSKEIASKKLLQKKEAIEMAQRKGWQVFIETPDGNFAELQRIDEFGKPVYYITQSNLNAAITTRASKLWTGGALGLNLNGQGMIVGEWDGGPIRGTHQEFGTRVVQKDGVAFTTSNGNNQHATHVGGTMIASGVTANAKGMAHQATLWANEWNNDTAEMTSQASQGLILSNHSYGYNPQFLSAWQFGFYDEEAAAWDEIAVNAPYYTMVKAAGNDRGAGYNPSGVFGTTGYNLVNGAATAKNVLVIGAVSAVTNYTSPSSVVMSSFSSWGPTDDGRIKPDVVGCGVSVYSTTSTSNTAYSTLSGTSMASPNVTGTLTLIQQHYKNLNSGSFMRSATLRGLVIHTADEAGSAAGPDYRFGWGLVNAEKAVNAITNRNTSSIIDERTLNNGGTYTANVVASGSGPLEVTIVWNDPKGTPLASGTSNSTSVRLVNDLDIRVTYNGTTTFPWRLDPASPTAAATRGDNVRDNVEKITIDSPVAGATYTITVSHKGALASAQAYSLIATGVGSGTPPPVCSIPSSLTTSAISTTGATLNWGAVSGAVTYDVRLRTVGSATWTDFLGRTGTSVGITGLVAGTNYEWQIRTNCSSSTTAYSASSTFSTSSVLNWCASRGTNNTYEWIDLVQLGSINRSSGKETNGYLNTGLSTNLARGSSQTISYSAAFSSTAYTEYWKVYIDWNQDGDFVDSGELVASRSSNLSTTLTSTFTVPTTATLGQTRMRISMSDANQSSCTTFTYGEVEDYTINVTSSGARVVATDGNSLAGEELDVTIFPNPSTSGAKISLQFSLETEANIQILDMSGKVVRKETIKGANAEISTEGFSRGMYILQVESGSNKITKKLIVN